jgi:hypothetical protein
MEANIYNLMDIESHDIQAPSNGGQRVVEYVLATIELVLVARFLLQLFDMSHAAVESARRFTVEEVGKTWFSFFKEILKDG